MESFHLSPNTYHTSRHQFSNTRRKKNISSLIQVRLFRTSNTKKKLTHKTRIELKIIPLESQFCPQVCTQEIAPEIQNLGKKHTFPGYAPVQLHRFLHARQSHRTHCCFCVKRPMADEALVLM